MSTANDARVSTTGQIITERDLRRGMSLSNISIVFAMFFMTAGGMPLAMLMERLHASGKLVGLLSTVGLAAGVFQVFSTLLTERLPTRKPMWFWNSLIHRSLWIVVPILLVLAATVFPGLMPRLPLLLIVAIGISSIFASMGSAPWLSWMSDFLPDHLRGRFWAMRNAFIYGSMLVAIFVFGWIMDCFPSDRSLLGFTGFILVFTLAVVFGVSDVFVHNRVLEPVVNRKAGAVSLRRILLDPLRDREFVQVILCVGIWQFSIYLVAPFSAIFLKEAYHVTYSQLSYTTVASGIGGILGAFVGKLVVDRMGARTLSAVALLIFGACVLVWFFMRDAASVIHVPFFGGISLPQPILALILISIPCSLCGALIGACQTTLITSKAPEENRTMAIALYQGCISLIAACGSGLGGYLVDAYRDYFAASPFPLSLPLGDTFSYFHVLIVLQIGIIWLVLVPMHLRIRESRKGVSFRTAILGLVTGNPVRMVSNMFNLHTLQSSGEPSRKARAIRELGESRIAIAVSDLIDQMDDADADVREEAVRALGQIGNSLAIEALLNKFEDADSDIAPEIAKAFRKSKDSRAVPALMRKLAAHDPVVQAESARTLGVLGDKQAVRPLLDLLYASPDAKVISASSEALARLGEMDAIFKILPRMRQTNIPVLKRSMGCAVGDLLGRPGEFYRVFHGEQQAYGAVVASLMAKLKEQIRAATRETLTEAGRNTVERLDQLESAYLLRNYKGCVTQALDVAIALSNLKYGIHDGGDPEVFVEVLIWHDRRFGVGTWYLDLLREAGDPDALEALLALYFLSTWNRE